jgi:IS30 family transposase
MQSKPRKSITEEQWQQAVETFELGYKNGSQIARDLGVSDATVSREFKRRGARKGCRVAETMVGLVAELNELDRRRAIIREVREAELAKRSAAVDAMVDELMRSLIAASKTGSFSDLNEKVAEVGGALAVKLARS